MVGQDTSSPTCSSTCSSLQALDWDWHSSKPRVIWQRVTYRDNLDFEVCSHSFMTEDLQLGCYRSVFDSKYKLILDVILDYWWTHAHFLGSGASLNTVCHRSLTSVSKMSWELSKLICLKSNPKQIWLISQWKQFPIGQKRSLGSPLQPSSWTSWAIPSAQAGWLWIFTLFCSCPSTHCWLLSPFSLFLPRLSNPSSLRLCQWDRWCLLILTALLHCHFLISPLIWVRQQRQKLPLA